MEKSIVLMARRQRQSSLKWMAFIEFYILENLRCFKQLSGLTIHKLVSLLAPPSCLIFFDNKSNIVF